jgi:uncharacterized protein
MLIDVHGHLGRVCMDRREFMDVTNVIAKMDAWGIDLTCMMALSEHPEGAYLESSTEDVLAACSRYPQRLVPFCLIDPRYGNRPDMDFTHLLEEYAGRGCKGIGEFLPKLDFDDPRCLNLYRQAARYKLPVLFDMMDCQHSYGLRDDFGLPKLEHALQACPETVFIGHGPTFWAEISGEVPADNRAGYPKGPVKPGGAVPRLLRKYPTMWAEISAGSGHNAVTRDPAFGIEFLDEFQDKVMFGTDTCRRSDVNGPYFTVEFMRKLEATQALSTTALEKIRWQNAVRLLGLQVRGG